MKLNTLSRLFFIAMLYGMASVNAMAVSPRLDWLLAHAGTDQLYQYVQEIPATAQDLDGALQHASRKGYPHAIILLINHGARAHEFDENIFIRAINTKQEWLINFLLDHHTLITTDTIEHALIYGNESFAKSILNHLLPEECTTILAHAIHRQKWRAVAFMRRAGICITRRRRHHPESPTIAAHDSITSWREYAPCSPIAH